jgi:proline iminopeptidase
VGHVRWRGVDAGPSDASDSRLGWDWHPHYQRNLAARLGSGQARLTELKGRDRTEAEDRELAVLQWSADFADPGKAVGYAEQMATPASL